MLNRMYLKRSRNLPLSCCSFLSSGGADFEQVQHLCCPVGSFGENTTEFCRILDSFCLLQLVYDRNITEFCRILGTFCCFFRFLIG